MRFSKAACWLAVLVAALSLAESSRAQNLRQDMVDALAGRRVPKPPETKPKRKTKSSPKSSPKPSTKRKAKPSPPPSIKTEAKSEVKS